MASAFNKYFASVFNNRLGGAFRDDSNDNPGVPLMDPINFSNNDVKCAINKLKTNKSFGVDNIYARTLKETQDEISPILTYLFNYFIVNNFVPNDWKCANVVPIF